MHLGRTVAFARSVGGEPAVRRVLNQLGAVLSAVLASLGARSVVELGPSHLTLPNPR